MSVYHHIAIHYYIFLEFSFLTASSLSFLLIIRFIINHLLLFNFIQAFYTDGAIYTKDNLFKFNNGAFDHFLKVYFRRYISTRYI